MSYATTQDLIDRFGQTELIQLTDLTNSGQINQTEVDRALDMADAEIDGRLASKYQLPLVTIPKIIIGFACDIARYRLYKGVATDLVEKNYEYAIKYLDQVARGQIGLGVDATGTAAVPSNGPQVQSSDMSPVFTQDSLADYTDDCPSYP